jgi:hypothetical protein
MLTSSVHGYYLQDMSTTKYFVIAVNRGVCILPLLREKRYFTEYLPSKQVKHLKCATEYVYRL